MDLHIEAKMWGSVSVRLDNRYGLTEDLLEEILHSARLPQTRVLLVLDTENGWPGYRGVAFMSELLQLSGVITRTMRKCLGTPNVIAASEWDYGVYLPKVTAEWARLYEPYFAFYLWHELEHVRIMIQDPNLHWFAAWLSENWKRFCGETPGIRTYEFPWELHCHTVAKQLAISEYGGAFEDACQRVRPLESQKQQEVISFIMTLPCSGERPIEEVAGQLAALVRERGIERAVRNEWENKRRSPGTLASMVNLERFL